MNEATTFGLKTTQDAPSYIGPSVAFEQVWPKYFLSNFFYTLIFFFKFRSSHHLDCGYLGGWKKPIRADHGLLSSFKNVFPRSHNLFSGPEELLRLFCSKIMEMNFEEPLK